MSEETQSVLVLLLTLLGLVAAAVVVFGPFVVWSERQARRGQYAPPAKPEERVPVVAPQQAYSDAEAVAKQAAEARQRVARLVAVAERTERAKASFRSISLVDPRKEIA